MRPLPSCARLVEDNYQLELADNLAAALVTKADTMLGRWGLGDTAIGAYDEAIAIRRRLIQQNGRNDLIDRLATALVNKGLALGRLGRSAEAVKAYDEAISDLRYLVEHEDRRELADSLATALMNKAIALEDLGGLEEACGCHAQGIKLLERQVSAGMAHLVSHLVHGLRNRFHLLLRVGQWTAAAADLRRALELAIPCFQSGIPPTQLVKNVTILIRTLDELSLGEFQHLDAGALWRKSKTYGPTCN